MRHLITLFFLIFSLFPSLAHFPKLGHKPIYLFFKVGSFYTGTTSHFSSKQHIFLHIFHPSIDFDMLRLETIISIRQLCLILKITEQTSLLSPYSYAALPLLREAANFFPDKWHVVNKWFITCDLTNQYILKDFLLRKIDVLNCKLLTLSTPTQPIFQAVYHIHKIHFLSKLSFLLPGPLDLSLNHFSILTLNLTPYQPLSSLLPLYNIAHKFLL